MKQYFFNSTIVALVGILVFATGFPTTAPKLQQPTPAPAIRELLTINPPKVEVAAPVASAPTPAPAPVVPAPVIPPPVIKPPDPVGCSYYVSLVSQYGWNVTVALAVMNAESSCNPNNDNPGDYHATCMGSRGLFQIGCDSSDNYAGMFDAAANIAQAYRLYSSRGWQPWGATTCRYKVVCY